MQNIPSWVINWLKEKFLKKSSEQQHIYPKKIYIDRGDSTSNVSKLRKIINENEIRDLLLREGFKIVRLGTLDFVDQVQYFNNAEYIVGLHGAGFANITFCKANARILEFRMHKTGKMWDNLAKTNRLRYNSIKCSPTVEDTTKQLGHIEVPLEELKNELNVKNT